MGLFSPKNPKVPNTISDKQMADLSRQARKADKIGWLSPEGVARAKRSERQRRNARWS